MKQILSVLMTLSVLGCVLSYNVSAAEEKQFLIKDEMIEEAEWPLIVYDELYYHYDESGNIDWALVYCDDGIRDEDGEYFGNADVFGNKIIMNEVDGDCKYFVYDPNGFSLKIFSEEFIIHFPRLASAWGTQKYPGLKEAVYALDTGYFLGDVNYDNTVNIKDVTKLQRCLAEYSSIREPDFPSVYNSTSMHCHDGSGKLKFIKSICDTDKNGVFNIDDVTQVQRWLADIDEF